MKDHIRQNQNFYQAELGEFPSDWPEATLNELNSGQSPALKAGPFGSSLTKDIYVKSGFKVYGQEQVIRGDLTYGNYFIDEKKYRELKSCAVTEGDILLSLVGTAGKLLVVNSSAKAGVINPRLIRFRFDSKKISSNFFKYMFESEIVQNHLETSAQGGTMAVLNAGMLKNLPIPLPVLPEQTAIANALSDVDALLTELENLIAKKQAIKTATMQQLLTGKTRLPQFATYTEGEKQGVPQGKCKGTKPSELGEIPEDWDVSTIADISLVPMQNGLFYEPARKGKGVPLINVSDMYTSAPISVESLELFNASKTELKAFKVNEGDLFFTRSSIVPNGIAFCNVLPKSDKEVVFDSHLIRVRVNPKIADYNYVYLNCLAKHSRLHLIANSKTATMTTIDQKAINCCPVLLPCKEEQTAIATILSDMDSEIQTLEQRLAKTRQIKQGMMQELLTGRTRLPFKRLETEQDGGS